MPRPMNPAEMDALVATVQAAKASDAPNAAYGAPDDDGDPLGSDFGVPATHAAERPSASELSLGVLLDLTLPVHIELGRASMTVQEILRLGRGAVIQLDRLAGEPIDVYVGERKFAEGEVVVLGEHFGVRIVRIFAGAAPQAAAA